MNEQPPDHAPVGAFISHASSDREQAMQICRTLEGGGVTCWIAPRDIPPGQEYGEAIIDGIRRSRALVLVLSDAANASTMVRREVERGASAGKPILSFRIQDVAPARSLAFFASPTDTIDAFEGPIAEHARGLLEVLADPHAVHVLASDLASRVRNRSARRRVSYASVALAAIAAAALLLILLRPEPGFTDDQARRIAEERGIDIDNVSADDFNVSLTTFAGSPSLLVRSTPEIESLVTDQMLQVRIGDRPWEILYPTHEGTIVHILTEAEREVDGVVSLRIVAVDNEESRPKHGPFVTTLHVRQAVRDFAASGFQQLKRRIEDAQWLTSTGSWRFDSDFEYGMLEGVRVVRLGVAPHALTTEWVVPRADQHEGPGMHVGEPVDSVRVSSEGIEVFFPFVRSRSLYMQVVYVDGTESDIRGFQRGD